ncbi:DgyrCDS7463 [Dimorphilus gyrociliatus]|uniref:DgyrCDS7463 n=1 Tax=Dimorphilus gyrociliatus TaxID=2664684 RepID=A0A7I8VTC0_9ANNE|nr:DgyrCDS7463 [Dimorphilus gyrociliatus]
MVHRSPYYLALGLMILSLVLCGVAYGTGHWYIGGGHDNKFERLGLWEACFNGYEHTSDYIGKAYYGCWWMFHKEYSYVRGWMMPSWFISVQSLMSFAVVFEILSVVVLIKVGKSTGHDKAPLIACGLTIINTFCIAVSVIVFGVMIGEDRTWMPRFDLDYLGWSFGLAVLSGFFSAFAAISICTYTLMLKYEALPKYDESTASLKGYPA